MNKKSQRDSEELVEVAPPIVKIPSLAQTVFDELFFDGEFVIHKDIFLEYSPLKKIKRRSSLKSVLEEYTIQIDRMMTRYESKEVRRFSDNSILTLVTIGSPYSLQKMEYGVLCGDFYYSSNNILYPLF